MKNKSFIQIYVERRRIKRITKTILGILLCTMLLLMYFEITKPLRLDDFKDGVAVAYTPIIKSIKEGFKYCYVNSNNEIISDYYDYAKNFSEGFGLVKRGSEYRFVKLINGRFQEVLGRYTYAENFCDGSAWVSQGKNNFYIDQEGNHLPNGYWLSVRCGKDSVLVMNFESNGKFTSHQFMSNDEAPHSSQCNNK